MPAWVGIAPDWHGTGTNALAMALPARMVPDFGSGSLARHVAAAHGAGLKPQIIRTDTLALDVDDADSLACWRALPTRPNTRSVFG